MSEPDLANVHTVAAVGAVLASRVPAWDSRVQDAAQVWRSTPLQRNIAQVSSKLISSTQTVLRRAFGDDRRVCLTKGQATKGARWMPWRQGPMKDVARLRKARASCLASSTRDFRMGQPGPLYRGSRPAQHIGRHEGTGGTETSKYPEEKK